MSNINLNDILKSFGIKDEFVTKSKNSIKEAKEGAYDKSIFDNKEAFIEYYTDEIFDTAQRNGDDVRRSFFGLGGVNAVGVDTFISNAMENGYLEEEDADGFQAIIDRNNDGFLDKSELNELIGTAYDAYDEEVPDVTTPPSPKVEAEPADPSVPDVTTPPSPKVEAEPADPSVPVTPSPSPKGEAEPADPSVPVTPFPSPKREAEPADPSVPDVAPSPAPEKNS
ncbi:MAG TPA: hypothetical protein H9673_04790 [Candidatus Adamsella sp.]|nr:hypothetical protein [Candidatus Adamsella sp.]